MAAVRNAVTPSGADERSIAATRSVVVMLTCLVCGKSRELRPMFLLTKFGVLRVMGATDFYVNGAGAYCAEHRPTAAQDNETWAEYDRKRVVRDLIEEGQPKMVEPEPRAKRIAEVLTDA